MRNAFLRMFFSIVSITLLILGVQTLLVINMNQRMRMDWSQAVYESYFERVKTNIEENAPPEGWTIESVWPALVQAADDRISGLLIRDNEGRLVASFGKTSKGGLLPVPPGYERSPSEVFSSETGTYNKADFLKTDALDPHVAEYESSDDIHTRTSAMRNSEVKVIDKGKDDIIIFPPDVKVQDVTGTVDLFYGGERLGSVDVLTFTPMTYKFTADLVQAYLRTFFITIPIALVISLVFGFIISRRNVRFTEAISRALFDLSEGRHNVPLPKSRVDGYKKMVSSISHLDQRLQDHERARQAWLCSISHDLNTPVTSMKLLLDGMADGIFPVDAAHVQMISKENDLLQERIQSVVTYSTLQSPDTVANTSDVDVLELVDAVLRQFSQDDEMRVDVQVDAPSIFCDFSLMQIACKELVSNALAASAGRVQWRVLAAISSKGKDAQGRGRLLEMDFINDGVLGSSQIDFFEPWSRGDQSRTASGGSGLGLSIVGQVMRLHGGSASIRNFEAENSTEPNVLVQLVWPDKE